MKITLYICLAILITLSCSQGDGNQNLNPKASEPATITRLKPYLIFPGTCREALEFYRDCFDGKIEMMQTFAEAGIDVPEDAKQRIFNSELRVDSLHIMASDNLPANETVMGNNFALFLVFTNRTELELVFQNLSEGGKVLFPIKENFGMLVDQFGIHWMLEIRN